MRWVSKPRKRPQPWVWAPLVGALVACSDAPPTVQPAATLEGVTLDAERLADWMILGQPLPIDEATALRLAEHWIEVSAVAQALANGVNMTAPSTVTEATEGQRRTRLRTAFLEEKVPETTPSPKTVTRTYKDGNLRLVAHVFRAVSPAATRSEVQRQEAAAQAILEALRGGGSWEEASASSEDATTQDLNGLMGLFARGELPVPLDQQVFALPEGAISGVVPSPQGLHILYRPRLEDVRPFYATLLTQRLAEQRRQAVADSLVQALGATPAPGALDQLADIAGQPFRLADPSAILVEAGGLTAADVALALSTLSSDDRSRLVDANPETRAGMLMRIASDHIVWRTAEDGGATLTELDHQATRAEFVGQVETVARAVDPQTTGIDGVDRYFEAFLARRRDQVALPGGLAQRLLADTDWSISEAGIAHAVGRARTLLDALGDRR